MTQKICLETNFLLETNSFDSQNLNN